MFPDSSPAAEIHAKILDTLPTLGLTHEPASAVTAVRSQLLDLSAEDLIGHEVVDRHGRPAAEAWRQWGGVGVSLAGWAGAGWRHAPDTEC